MKIEEYTKIKIKKLIGEISHKYKNEYDKGIKNKIVSELLEVYFKLEV